MHQCAAHVGAIVSLDDPRLSAAYLAQALDQLPQLAGSQYQGLEIVGIDLGAGDRAEDLAETGHDTLLRYCGVARRLPVDAEHQYPARRHGNPAKGVGGVIESDAAVRDAAQSEIVGNAAVQEVDVFRALGVEITV